MTISDIRDIPDYIRSKHTTLTIGNVYPRSISDGTGSCITQLKQFVIKKYTHEIDGGTFMKYTVCTTLTDGNCCHISPGFMIQVKYLASVVSPVRCCNTGDLEDTRRQADQWPMFEWYSKGLRQFLSQACAIATNQGAKCSFCAGSRSLLCQFMKGTWCLRPVSKNLWDLYMVLNTLLCSPWRPH